MRCVKPCKKNAINYISLTVGSTMHIQTRLDPPLFNALREVADQKGVSLSEYLRKLVEQDLESRNGKRISEERDGNLDRAEN